MLNIDASGDGLGVVLYQEQYGEELVIAYASRGLRASKCNYPAHKLEFLALKLAVCDKSNDYLYGNKLTLRTNNNPLNCKVRYYRSSLVCCTVRLQLFFRLQSWKEKNQDADFRIRLPTYDKETLFNDVIMAISQAALVSC